MKTIATLLVLAITTVNPTLRKNDIERVKASGTIAFSVVYNETETVAMSSSLGTPQKQKMKVGTDFDFNFTFDDQHARFEKVKQEIPKGPKRISFGASSFAVASTEDEANFAFDEFDTAVFDFGKNMHYGLATIFEKQIMVEMPISTQNHGFEISGKTKKVAGYEVKQTISKDGEFEVWFTTELDVYSPWQFEGIVGVVLEFKDDRRTVTASNVELSSIETSSFELPDRRVLELEQYQDLKKEELDEQMKLIQEKMKGFGQDISFKNGGITIKKGGNNH